jgi:hypothetical protein
MPPSIREMKQRYPWDLFPDDEDSVKAKFLPAFRELGTVHEEVAGDCKFLFEGQESRKRLRIDAVLEIDESVDRYKSCIGIEFKGGLMSCADLGKYMRQCVDYRQTYWHGFGYLPIVMCPGFTHLICQSVDNGYGSDPLTEGQGEHLAFVARRFLAAFGIGEAFFIRPLPTAFCADHLRISFADALWLEGRQRVNYTRKEFGRNQGSK